MHTSELLAPAGDMECVEAAVRYGADAVYLGYAAYSARAGAGNFDEEQLRAAIAFCHLHHVRVHVTVNTLVKDGELDGGYGQRVAGFYGMSDMKVCALGVSKAFHTDFNADALLAENGISVESVLSLIRNEFNK